MSSRSNQPISLRMYGYSTNDTIHERKAALDSAAAEHSYEKVLERLKQVHAVQGSAYAKEIMADDIDWLEDLLPATRTCETESAPESATPTQEATVAVSCVEADQQTTLLAEMEHLKQLIEAVRRQAEKVALMM